MKGAAKIGRPPKSVRREFQIEISVSTEERAFLDRKAKRDGISRARWIRRQCGLAEEPGKKRKRVVASDEAPL